MNRLTANLQTVVGLESLYELRYGSDIFVVTLIAKHFSQFHALYYSVKYKAYCSSNNTLCTKLGHGSLSLETAQCCFFFLTRLAVLRGLNCRTSPNCIVSCQAGTLSERSVVMQLLWLDQSYRLTFVASAQIMMQSRISFGARCGHMTWQQSYFRCCFRSLLLIHQ